MKSPRAMAADISILPTLADRRAALAGIEPELIRGLVQSHVRIFFERRSFAKACLDKVQSLR